MTYTSEQLQEITNNYISKLPAARTPASLYEPIRYALSAGGKRMRPVLMLMTYNLFKDDVESILLPAAGLEIYHNYTLLHDDVMDHSDLRRGRPTVHRKWNNNTAILCGDIMMVLAYKYLCNCPDDKLHDVLACFIQTALEVGEGQQLDIDFEERSDVAEAEYIEMIRLKTSVLFACAMQLGAILADATKGDQTLLYHVGECLGLAFQLQDDYLDVYGDEAVFGKTIGLDICNNKKTYLLINACIEAKGGDKIALERWLAAPPYAATEKIAGVTAIFNKVGVDKLTAEKIDYYFREAARYIDATSVPEERKMALRAYVDSLRHRQS